MKERNLFDFFISYKRQDSSEFVESLTTLLENRNYDVWLDKLEVLPGDSVLTSIEKGISNSLTIVLVFSPNYFAGWSEHERRAAFNLATSKKVHLIPIWYKVDNSFVSENAPLFADINAILFSEKNSDPVLDVVNQLSRSMRPADKRAKLFELFIKCIYKKFPDDPELKVWVAVLDNNIPLLKEALDAGANPNISNTEIYNKYNKISIECGCFEEFRKLYLFFHENGELQNQG